MSYYEKLKRDKENDIKFDMESRLIKECIFEISSLYAVHDGEFAADLANFIKKWKEKK